MRRALVVVALLAAPALAATPLPPPGAIAFTDGSVDASRAAWINLYECEGGTATRVYLSWTTQLAAGSSFPAGAVYQVYASNRESTGSTCITTTDVASGTIAGGVGATLTGQAQTVLSQPFTLIDFVAVAGLGCAVAVDTPIFVCVQAYAPDASAIGFAKGTLTLSTSAPAPPTDVTATPAGDGALSVSWSAPAGDPPAYEYLVVASSDPGLDPNVHALITGAAGAVVGCTLTGLVNGAPYVVVVTARSQAGNEGAPSVQATGTPIASAPTGPRLPRPQGTGQGGCGAGGAGPLALLGVAALLARPRRRAR
jgi:hypothetical protein